MYRGEEQLCVCGGKHSTGDTYVCALLVNGIFQLFNVLLLRLQLRNQLFNVINTQGQHACATLCAQPPLLQSTNHVLVGLCH